MKIKWNRSKDGCCTSKDGRFSIKRAKVSGDVYYQTTDTRTGKVGGGGTLKLAKAWAQVRQVDEWPLSFETYDATISMYNGIRLDPEPSAFNGSVRVVRYRVTVEPIDDPPEVIAARLQKLWRECNNHHMWGPIAATAKRHGVDLKNSDRGKDAKPQW